MMISPRVAANYARTMMPVPPADTPDRRGNYNEHVCFPLAQEPVEQLVPRPTRRRLACQLDRQLVDAVKVSVLLIDVIPTGITGANNRQMTSEDDISTNKKVIADFEMSE